MLNVTFHDDARAEYIESYVWYHERGSHIAKEFEREVDHALEAVQSYTERGSIYVRDWRRILLRRFPFGIVYGVRDGQILVIAVMHTRRKPGYWRNRKFDVLPD